MGPEFLRRLAVLAEVADGGSLSAAARRLGLAKSSVSHHVAALEREIGAKVLDRLDRGVALTAIGEVLAAHGRAVVREADQALAAAKEAEAPRGTLRISMPAGIADSLLIPMIAAFLESHPGIAIDAVATDQMVDLVAERIDIAFRIGELGDSPYVARTLHVDRDIFVATPGYLATAPPIAIPPDLSRHPLIGFTAFGKTQSFRVEGYDGSSVEIEMTCRITTTSGLSIKHWVLAGLGVARMPHSVVQQDLEAGALLRVLPDYTAQHLTLSVVYLPERFRAANARRLINHAIAYFKAQRNS